VKLAPIESATQEAQKTLDGNLSTAHFAAGLSRPFGDLSLIIIAVLEIAACTEIAAGFKYISKCIQNRKEGIKGDYG
jgi:uncharacterized membrane protein YphA (DoxX/SURF4 family)